MKRINIFILSILAAVITAAAADFTVLAPRNVIAGNKFSVTFRLKNGEGSGLKTPEIEGCTFLYGPTTSTMQNYQNINGRASSSVIYEYSFIYRADKEGTFTIPPASINVNGQTLHTEAVKFKVLPPDSNGGGHQPDVRIDDPSTQTADRNVTDKDVFIRIILNKSTAYKEEAMECVLKLYTKYSSISGITAVTPPTFDGFLIDEDNSMSQANEIEHYNGQNYLTAVLKKYIIFPQKSGKLTINSGEFDINVIQHERVNMGFFTTTRPVEKTVRTRPGNIAINILPLPEPQPAGFSGAVGQYNLTSEISSTSLRTGEAASLKVTITGSGDVKYIQEPQIEFPTEFEQYTPKTDINSRIAGNTVSGTVGIEYTFVPQTVGQFTIPVYEFIYFDPSAKKYVTLTTPAYDLNVAKGASSTVAETTDQQNIKAKVTDILHIKTGDKGLKSDHTPVIYSLPYWGFYLLIILVFGVIIYIYAKQVKLSADVTGMKMAKANKVARRRLKEAKKFMDTQSYEKFYAEILRAIWGYLGDKLAMPASQLTRQNISDTLRDNNTPDEIINRLIAVIDDCEMARYTPMDNSASAGKVYNETSELMKEMESLKK